MPLLWDGESKELKRLPEWKQVVGLTILALFVNFVAAMLIAPFGFTDAGDFQDLLLRDQGPLLATFIVVIAAPFVETAYGQFLPIAAARLVKRSFTEAILWSAAWFALLHLSNGPAHVFQTFFVGWVLGATLLFGWRESWIKAYRLTFLVHALHNGVVFTLFMIITALLGEGPIEAL